jgi:putative hydrolase of the HAD superfamily
MSGIRVIVSDLGKVLLPFDVERVWSALNPHFGIGREEATKALRAVLRETRFGAGGVAGPDFHRLLAERTGLGLCYDDFCLAWSDMFWEDAAVIDLIADAPVERRYILSNTNDIHWRFIRERYPHVLGRFDEALASHELKMEKPDPEIYRHVAELSGYPVQAHLFIDDIAENVDAARQVGMDAILHTDAESLWSEFRERGLATEAQRPSSAAKVERTPDSRAIWAVEE